MPPRLAVGVIGHPHLSTLLERAGHTTHAIDPFDDPGAIQHVDLVILDGTADDIRATAAELAPHARPRQMFLHTALDHGPQLLDDVETSHAIVMAAHNLFGTVWVTAAADEMGETLVSILIAEAGGTAVPISDQDRPAIAAAQHLRALEQAAREDAFDILRATIPTLEPLQDSFFQAPSGTLPAITPSDLDRLAAAIDDPGARRLFVDLHRRRAEQSHATDIELWAYEHYEGSRP
ncbi:hypothetical protein M5J20_08670 [Corynebacterium sp. TA-R-1]|uniref:CGL2689-like C-terminal domain-containing protein n=1 Tax=Corynebacterium stercoris TaxID=2943490 RepID=A0ABT1G2J8_9CORY|nr:hypothetical protein [Corynebacterium stercoris]MCP1388255.1 hypothetical protein [Corynebacterium stercoris]